MLAPLWIMENTFVRLLMMMIRCRCTCVVFVSMRIFLSSHLEKDELKISLVGSMVNTRSFTIIYYDNYCVKIGLFFYVFEYKCITKEIFSLHSEEIVHSFTIKLSPPK